MEYHHAKEKIDTVCPSNVLTPAKTPAQKAVKAFINLVKNPPASTTKGIYMCWCSSEQVFIKQTTNSVYIQQNKHFVTKQNTSQQPVVFKKRKSYVDIVSLKKEKCCCKIIDLVKYFQYNLSYNCEKENKCSLK